jgi:hypothetical protein
LSFNVAKLKCSFSTPISFKYLKPNSSLGGPKMWQPYCEYWIKIFDLMFFFFGQILVRTIWFYQNPTKCKIKIYGSIASVFSSLIYFCYLIRAICFYEKNKYYYIVHFVFTIFFLLKAIDNTKENPKMYIKVFFSFFFTFFNIVYGYSVD